ncbi:MAG: hypothetical protein ABIK09_00470 [Pseudomonadota bacterium]
MPIDLQVERATGFLKKPYGVQELGGAVAQLLGKVTTGSGTAS